MRWDEAGRRVLDCAEVGWGDLKREVGLAAQQFVVDVGIGAYEEGHWGELGRTGKNADGEGYVRSQRAARKTDVARFGSLLLLTEIREADDGCVWYAKGVRRAAIGKSLVN